MHDSFTTDKSDKSEVRILVASRPSDETKFSVQQLIAAGYKVDLASAKQDLFALLEIALPDLILFEKELHDISGLGLCSTIKGNAKTKHIPTVLMAYSSDTHTIAEAFSVGASDYVSRPIRKEELLTRVSIQIKSNLKKVDRKRKEDELARLTSFFQATPGWIGIFNAELDIQWGNHPLKSLRPDISWDSISKLTDLYPEWVNKKLRDEALPSAQLNGIWKGEMAVLDEKGNQIPVSQSIVANYPSNDAPTIYSTIMTDIRSQKLAEESKQESESKFLTLLSNLDGVVYRCLFDNAWTMLFMSDAILALSGYPASDFISNQKRSFASIIHPEDIEYVANDSRPKFSLEYRIVHKDGSIKWVAEKGKVINNQGKEAQYLEGVIVDISDRKRAEFEQERLIAILECTSDFIGTCDLNGNLLYLNQSWRKLLQNEQEQPIFRRNISEQHPEWASDLLKREAFPEAVKKGIWMGETALLDARGNEIPVSQVVLAHKSHQGIVDYYSTILRDISGLKQVEFQLQKSNEELARATRMKDEFLANMSHELRTPLNSILGMAEGLQEKIFGDINPKQEKAVQTISSSGLHLLELINDILDLAKVESGKTELNIGLTSIQYVFQSAVNLVSHMNKAKNIQIYHSIPSSFPDIYLDERRIRQVLINLLSNALKFTSVDGEIHLGVKMPSIRDENRQAYFQLYVRDNGIGISPENLETLFQPFSQVDSALNRQYDGTGLGLALVKKIVELHQGFVCVESTFGKGSTFVIELPYILEEEIPYAGESVESYSTLNLHIQEDDISSKAVSTSILLVEHNVASNHSLSSYLRAHGFDVTIVSEGMDIFDISSALRPDIIILDTLLPDNDGIEIVRCLKQFKGISATPIIVYSTFTHQEDRDRYLDAGVNKLIRKPAKLRQFLSLIRNLLD